MSYNLKPPYGGYGRERVKAGKSCETCLTNRTWAISYPMMSLVINALGDGHTDTQAHTNTQTKAISRYLV